MRCASLSCRCSHAAWSTTHNFGRMHATGDMARFLIRRRTQCHRVRSPQSREAHCLPLAAPAHLHLRSRSLLAAKAVRLRSCMTKQTSSRSRRSLGPSSIRTGWSGKRRNPRTEQGALCDSAVPFSGPLAMAVLSIKCFWLHLVCTAFAQTEAPSKITAASCELKFHCLLCL